MDDVQELVLQPFREMIEMAETALENAKDAGFEPLQTAAQQLMTDGQRALAKLDPICKRYYESYSTNFITALKENGTSDHGHHQPVPHRACFFFFFFFLKKNRLDEPSSLTLD